MRSPKTVVIIESPDVAEAFATAFDFDWNKGWDAADVPKNLLGMMGNAMFELIAFEEIHLADLA